MGIGNTTPSSAIVAAFTGASPAEVTGRGTGIDKETFSHKVSVVEKILATNNPDSSDGIGVPCRKWEDSRSEGWQAWSWA